MYTYKIYRVEYVFEVYEIDQYGNMRNKILKEESFPSKEEAEQAFLKETIQHEYVKTRRVWKNAPHQYHSCGIRVREVLIKELDLQEKL
jgi:hypothetical protein